MLKWAYLVNCKESLVEVNVSVRDPFTCSCERNMCNSRHEEPLRGLDSTDLSTHGVFSMVISLRPLSPPPPPPTKKKGTEINNCKCVCVSLSQNWKEITNRLKRKENLKDLQGHLESVRITSTLKHLRSFVVLTFVVSALPT